MTVLVRAFWAKATLAKPADDGPSFGDLTRTIIGKFADWSQASSAR